MGLGGQKAKSGQGQVLVELVHHFHPSALATLVVGTVTFRRNTLLFTPHKTVLPSFRL
jgi:hypothetical protein